MESRCLFCGHPVGENTVFCNIHTPVESGKNHVIGNISLFIGEVSLHKLLRDKLLRGRKIIRYWVGTDVLLLYKFPPGRGKFAVIRHRLKHLLSRPLIDENWANGRALQAELSKITGISGIKSVEWPSRHGRVEKTRHNGLNLAYYHPRNDTYTRWVYGIDLIEQAIEKYPVVNWIKLDGTRNMNEILPILDGYIRPSRHDGWPRLIQECLINDIPFHWSDDGRPKLDDICLFIEKRIQTVLHQTQAVS